MTVTPLGTRADALPYPREGRRGAAPRRRGAPAQSLTSPAPAEPALTVSFEITLVGADRADDALEVLSTLRQLAQRLGAGTVGDDSGPAVRQRAPAVRLLPAAADLLDDDEPPDAGPSADDEPAADDEVRVLMDSRSVRRGTRRLTLSRLEFDLLLFFAENPRRVFTRVQLLQNVWGHRHTGERTVDVHIRRLRAKLGDGPLVTTYRGVGYRLAEEAQVRVVRSD